MDTGIKRDTHALKQAHTNWMRHQRILGSPLHLGFCRLILLGWMDDLPYDHSSLAAALEVPRQTVSRHVQDLTQRGFVWSERQRNRVIVLPTDKLVEFAIVELAGEVIVPC